MIFFFYPKFRKHRHLDWTILEYFVIELTVVDEPSGGRRYVVAVNEDGRARFRSARNAAAAALFLGTVLKDLDRSGLLSAGHAEIVVGPLRARAVVNRQVCAVSQPARSGDFARDQLLYRPGSPPQRKSISPVRTVTGTCASTVAYVIRTRNRTKKLKWKIQEKKKINNWKKN